MERFMKDMLARVPHCLIYTSTARSGPFTPSHYIHQTTLSMQEAIGTRCFPKKKQKVCYIVARWTVPHLRQEEKMILRPSGISTTSRGGHDEICALA